MNNGGTLGKGKRARGKGSTLKIYGAELSAKVCGAELGAKICGAEVAATLEPCWMPAQTSAPQLVAPRRVTSAPRSRNANRFKKGLNV